MKELVKKTILASALVLVASTAQAQFYGEVGYSWITAKDNVNGIGIKANPNAIRGILGFELHKNVAIEGLAALGVRDGDVKANGQTVPGVKLEVDNALGLYLKPKAKLNESFEIFARAGVARVEGTISVAGFGSASASETSFSWGGGLSYAISQTVGLNLDYMQYVSKDGFKATGFTLGLGMRF
jgi:opacity protein-like surface antigen